jgi:beta-fructofuranosidase
MTIPPKGVATTGFRDPFVSKWEGLSMLLGVDVATDYMLIASGERDRGPQLHLYKSNNLLDWQPVSTILDVQAGSNISPTSKLKFGMNFECASFFSFGARHYIIVGVEEDHDSKQHCARYLLWISGDLVLEDSKPKFKVKSHGSLDYGVLYAAHIFRDSDDRILQLGWADETTKQHVISKQGWAGCLAHPRELYEMSRPITNTDGGSDIWNIDQPSGNMTTLGIRTAPQISLLRDRLRISSLRSFSTIQSINFSIEATFCHLHGDEKFIFNVRQAPNSPEVTPIIFDLKNRCITVDRTHSSLENLGTSSPDYGPFTILPYEDLLIQIFVDNSILEVYANDRFALTSRIYPVLETSTGASYDFRGFDEANVEFRCWERLEDAWPARTVDESASLGRNPADEINGEKWWPILKV